MLCFGTKTHSVCRSSYSSPIEVINHWLMQHTNRPRATTLRPVLHPSPSTCEAPFALAHRSLSSAKCCFEINTWEAHSARWCNNRGGLLLPRYRETVEKTLSQVLLSLSPRPSGPFESISAEVFLAGCCSLLKPVCPKKKKKKEKKIN